MNRGSFACVLAVGRSRRSRVLAPPMPRRPLRRCRRPPSRPRRPRSLPLLPRPPRRPRSRPRPRCSRAPLAVSSFSAGAHHLRVAACGAGGDVPAALRCVRRGPPCEELGHAYADYRRDGSTSRSPFLAALRPKDLAARRRLPVRRCGPRQAPRPRFPTHRDHHHLARAGRDVRPIDGLAPDFLAHELAVHRSHLERLFEKPTRAPTTSSAKRRPPSPGRSCSPSRRSWSMATSR